MEKFKARQHYVFCEQSLNSTPDRIFPLLCPKREYEWIETWNCEIVFSNSGYAELDCVFNTHFPGDVKETWIVDKYEKNEVIQFIRFSDIRVMRYTISLSDNRNGTTTARWELNTIALNNDGNLFIENFSNSEFEKRIRALERMLNYYLATGEMLKINK